MKVASTPATSSFPWVRKSPMYLPIYPPFFLFAARSLAEWDFLIVFSRLSNFPCLLVKLSRCFPSSPSLFCIVSHLQAPRLCCLFQSTLASIRRISSQRALLTKHQHHISAIQNQASTFHREYRNYLLVLTPININNGRRQRKIFWWKVLRREGRCRREQEAAEPL